MNKPEEDDLENLNDEFKDEGDGYADETIEPDRLNPINANPKVIEEINNARLEKPDYDRYKKEDENASTLLLASGALGGGLLLLGAVIQGLSSAGLLGSAFAFPPAGIALIVLSGIAAVVGVVFASFKKYQAKKNYNILEEKERNIQEQSLDAKIDVISNAKQRLNSAAKAQISANKYNVREENIPSIKTIPTEPDVTTQKPIYNLYNDIRKKQNNFPPYLKTSQVKNKR